MPSSSPPRPSNSGVAFAELDKERGKKNKKPFTSEAANIQRTFLKHEVLETSPWIYSYKNKHIICEEIIPILHKKNVLMQIIYLYFVAK